MGYYMGDYYGNGGSYYRGDPFWGFLGRAVGGIVKMATGLGGATRAIKPIATLAKIPAISKIGTAVVTGGAAVGRMVAKHPVLSAAGAASVLAGATAGVAMHPGFGRAERGMHVSRKTGKMVRNRRMNVCNPRALRRSIRRATGFARLAMKTIHLIHPKKKGRFGGFKRRRKHA